MDRDFAFIINVKQVKKQVKKVKTRNVSIIEYNVTDCHIKNIVRVKNRPRI